MLARKHYSQKGNSKGRMNTSAVAGSTSTRINQVKRSQTNNTSKVVGDYTSEKYMKWKKHMVIKCSDVDNTTTRDCNYKCSTKIGRKYTDVHKDILFNTQSDYLQKKVERNSCFENEPKPYNNITAGCV